MHTYNDSRGFSAVEMMVVVLICGIISVAALPAISRTSSDMRSRSDARNVFNMVSLAKMRSAAEYTRARVFVDLSANSFSLQLCNRAANTWTTEGGAMTTSSGVAFGYSSLSTPPPNTQTAIGQAPQCRTACDATGTLIANTACIVFNSRGIPIASDGSPTGDDALYVSDGTAVYGTTLTATPLVRLWYSPASRLNWVKQ